MHSDRFLEQGNKSAYGTSGHITVPLLIPMRDNLYMCMISLHGDTSSYSNAISGVYWESYNRTTTSFQFMRYTNQSIQQFWVVLGY